MTTISKTGEKVGIECVYCGATYEQRRLDGMGWPPGRCGVCGESYTTRYYAVFMDRKDPHKTFSVLLHHPSKKHKFVVQYRRDYKLTYPDSDLKFVGWVVTEKMKEEKV